MRARIFRTSCLALSIFFGLAVCFSGRLRAENTPAPNKVAGVVGRIIENRNDPNSFMVVLSACNYETTGTGRPIAKATISSCPGLELKSPATTQLELPPQVLMPLKWKFTGKRVDGLKLQIDMNGKIYPVNIQSKINLDPSITNSFFGVTDKTKLKVVVRNIGQAWLAPGSIVDLSTSSGLKILSPASQKLEREIAPGEATELSWTVQGVAEGPAGLTLFAKNSSTTDTATESLSCLIVNEPFARAASSESITLKQKGLALGFPKYGDGHRNLLVTTSNNFSVPLAVARGLGEVIYDDQGTTQTHLIGGEAEGSPSSEAVTLVDRWKSPSGTQWQATTSIKLVAGDRAEVSSSLTSDKPAKLYAFQGPYLRVGEGTTGARKDYAMFPGLDYLEGGERSSGLAAPIATSHARVARYAPHPNRVSIPLMSIITDGTMVGMMWDPLQKWDGENDRPTALFASPNFLEHQSNHLIGLFVPSIPKWVDENTLMAERAYDLVAGKTLNITCTIFAKGHANEMTPMQMWFDHHPLPPMPELPRSRAEELKHWGFGGRPQADFVDYLHPATHLQFMPDFIDRTRSWLPRQDPSGAWVFNWEVDPGDAVLARLQNAWTKPFDVRGSYFLSRYGTLGDSTVGSCVVEGGISGIMPGKALHIVRAARLTGSPDFVDSANRAIQFMKRFKRPEGGQVWEEPLHTPDLLACGYAIQTFVEAYRFTGDKAWLDKAEEFAWTGLPFLYVWQAPEQKYMNYATLAYFGGAHCIQTLCGVAVTWNGLEYAKGLVELTQYRPKGQMPWMQIAEGIARWTLALQYPKTTSWPDYLDVVYGKNVASGMDYKDDRPGRILAMVDGLSRIPETKIVKDGQHSLRVTAEGDVKHVELVGSVLKISLDPWGPKNFAISIGGAAENQQVEIENPKNMAAPSRKYLPNDKLLVLLFKTPE